MYQECIKSGCYELVATQDKVQDILGISMSGIWNLSQRGKVIHPVQTGSSGNSINAAKQEIDGIRVSRS